MNVANLFRIDAVGMGENDMPRKKETKKAVLGFLPPSGDDLPPGGNDSPRGIDWGGHLVHWAIIGVVGLAIFLKRLVSSLFEQSAEFVPEILRKNSRATEPTIERTIDPFDVSPTNPDSTTPNIYFRIEAEGVKTLLCVNGRDEENCKKNEALPDSSNSHSEMDGEK